MEFVDVYAGLREGGRVFVNSTEKKPYYIDATAIALKRKLGTEQAPIVNTALVGFYLRSCSVALKHGLTAIDKHIPLKIKANKEAMEDAYYDTSSYYI
jgi:Pyruvate/2-oxoacid:ferredoxin oxidoreductase gamma subunit